MLALQASIGALNDLVDVEADQRVKPAKPLAARVVGQGTGRAVVVGGLVLGLALAATAGPLALGVAIVGVGAGYAYDLRLKGTAWGPLAFAVGVPLLPVFAWIGAVGSLPSSFVALIPAAVLAGSGLAIANALADRDDDRLTGIETAATRLGSTRAWRLHLAALVSAIVIAVGGLGAFGGSGPGLWMVAAGGTLVGLGVLMANPSRPRGRPHGWEIEAVGIGLLGIGWLLALGLQPG